MGFASGPVPPRAAWPVTSDPGPRPAVRADGVAAVALVLAGICGLLTWFLEGYLVGGENSAGVGLTGAKVFATLRAPDAGGVYDLTALAVLAVTIGGGALVLLGIGSLLPMNHRPIGAAALALTLVLVGSAGWLLLKTSTVLGSSPSQMIGGGHYGWHLIALAAVLGVIGSIRALVNG